MVPVHDEQFIIFLRYIYLPNIYIYDVKTILNITILYYQYIGKIKNCDIINCFNLDNLTGFSATAMKIYDNDKSKNYDEIKKISIYQMIKSLTNL